MGVVWWLVIEITDFDKWLGKMLYIYIISAL